jgi:hypothetical protein
MVLLEKTKKKPASAPHRGAKAAVSGKNVRGKARNAGQAAVPSKSNRAAKKAAHGKAGKQNRAGRKTL